MIVRRWRQIVGWLLVLVLVSAAYFAYARYQKRRNNRPKYRTAKIDRGNVAAKVTATGTLSARTTVVVGSQVSGRVAELFADYNSPVKKGQVLAKIDPRLFDAALRRTRASWMSAQAAVQKAEANHEQAKKARDRLLQLRESGLAGQADIDQAETTVATTAAEIGVAKAQLEQASAALEEAKVNLGFTTIVSPIDGVVLSRSVDVGQTVAASLQAPTLFTIAQDLRSIQVDTFISEADVGKLRSGMPATFTVDAYPGKHFEGQVREVRNAPQTVQNVVTYDAVLDVRNEALELKPGMTATVSFIWAERTAVLRIPNAALRFRAPENFGISSVPKISDPKGRLVWRLERDGRPSPQVVNIGITDGSYTELLSTGAAGEAAPDEGTVLREADEVITDVLVDPTAAATASGFPGTRPLGGGGGGGGGGSRRGL